MPVRSVVRHNKFSRTEDLGGRRHRFTSDRKPLHYQVGGAWVDFDLSPKDGAKWRISGAPFRVEFDKTVPAFTYRSAKGQSVSAELLDAGGTLQRTENGISWIEALPGVDVVFQAWSNGLSGFIIIKDARTKLFRWRVRGEKELSRVLGRDADYNRCELEVTETPETGGFIQTIEWTGRVRENTARRQAVWSWNTSPTFPVRIT